MKKNILKRALTLSLAALLALSLFACGKKKQRQFHQHLRRHILQGRHLQLCG